MQYELAQTGLQIGTYIVIGIVVVLVGAALFILTKAVSKKNKM